MSSKQDSGHGPVMMVFVDDFACTARLVDLPTSDRAGAASHTKASSESKRELMFSSQVLLSAGDNDYGIAFPLGDESDRLEELATYLRDNDNELKNFGLFEILKLLDKQGSESDEGVVELYFTLLIKTCLERLAGKTWISRLAICVPWLDNNHEQKLDRVFRQVKLAFGFDEVVGHDAHELTVFGSAQQRSQVNRSKKASGSYIASFLVWRHGLTGVVWELTRKTDGSTPQARAYYTKGKTALETPRLSYSTTDRIEQSGALVNMLNGQTKSPLVSNDTFYFPIKAQTSNEKDCLAIPLVERWKPETSQIAHIGRAALELVQESRQKDFAVQLTSASDIDCSFISRINFSDFLVSGSLAASPIVRDAIAAELRMLPMETNVPLILTSSLEFVFDGMQENHATSRNSAKGHRKTGVEICCSGIPHEVTFGAAIELPSPHSPGNDEVLKFTINKEDTPNEIEVSLDEFDNDQRYLLEPSEGDDGSLQLLMRVGTRPVALQVAGEKAEGGVALNLLPGGMYEVTFSDEERAELALQKRLLRFVQSGTSIFGRNSNAQDV